LVWASGAALASVLLLVFGLFGVVIVNGFGVFWPSPVVQWEMADGAKALGQWIRTETNPSTHETSAQLKTGNRELDSQRLDFHWYRTDEIVATTYPADAFVLERFENGQFVGFLEKIDAPALVKNAPSDTVADLHAAMAAGAREKADKSDPIAADIAALSRRLQRIRDARLKFEYRKKRVVESPDREPGALAAMELEIAGLKAEEDEIKRETDRQVAKENEIDAAIRKNVAVFRTAAGPSQRIPLADIVRAYQPNAMSIPAKAWHYAVKIRELLFDDPRESNTEGGLFPAIFGTVMLVFLMAFSCFPLGVLAGVYLGEYASDGFLVRGVRVAVNNLAGIPSIVYGIFGLGFFVHGIGGLIDQWFFPERVAAGISTFGTGGILWASMTLGLLTIPVVIVSTEEALRTIPRGVREGSYALGATKFQTLVRILIPMASPGIMTGFILAMARAAGEVAPLMITGVVKLAPSLPLDGQPPFVHADRKFMHLGFHIFDIGFQSPNVEASKPMVFVTTLLLVLLVLVMSSAAIALRNRMKRRHSSQTI
jgi:phosphate transport system permease protein